MRFSGRPAGAGVDYLFFGVYRRKNCDPGFHGTEYSKGRCEEYKMKKKRFGVIGIALAILFLLGAAPSVLAAGLPSVAIPVKVEVEGAAICCHTGQGGGGRSGAIGSGGICGSNGGGGSFLSNAGGKCGWNL